MQCITIGGATVDIIIQVSASDAERLTMHNADLSFMMLELGKKIETDAIDISVGGGAINAGVSMARLGHTVTPLIKIKDDMNGRKIIRLLKSENLNDTHILDTATQPTATSVLLSSVERDPTVFTYRGANTQLENNDITEEKLTHAQLVYITALSGQSAKTFPHIVNITQQSGAFVATNPGILQIQRYGDDIINALPKINCLTINAKEACELLAFLQKHAIQPPHNRSPEQNSTGLMKTGLSKNNHHMPMATYMKTATELGLDYMVITDGKKGVYMGTKTGIYFAPSAPVQVAGTIGAGDAFSSTLTSYLAQSNTTPEYALVAGTLNSASVVSYTDTQTGLLTKSQLEKKITKAQLQQVKFTPY